MLILRNNYYSSPEEEEYLQRMYGISQYVTQPIKKVVRKLKDKIIAGKNYLLGRPQRKVDAFGHMAERIKRKPAAMEIPSPTIPTKDAPFVRGREKLEEIAAKMRENQANYRERFRNQINSWGII